MPGFLLHRIDEGGEKDVYLVESTVDILVEQHLHGANHLVEVGSITELHCVRHHIRADSIEKCKTLAADRAIIDLQAFASPFLVLAEQQPEDIGVEASAEALVSGDEHDP